MNSNFEKVKDRSTNRYYLDLTGLKFNKLTVIKKAASKRSGSTDWECKCDCGKEIVYSKDHLTRSKNPVKTCGCEQVRSGKEHKQWNGYGDISGGWWHSHVTRERTQSYRKRVPVEVTIEEAWNLFLKQNKKCALSGIDLVISSIHRTNTASIDRIDSSKGYTIDNIQWVHKHINFMKRIYSNDYFIEMCRKVAKTHDGGGICELQF